MEQKNTTGVSLPGAIIIAGALIAIAVIWTKTPVPSANIATESVQTELKLVPVTSSDHIFGNPNASIKIVEYSDPSCPFCKIFHPTMKQIIDEYGPSGKVSWVYRHFPLEKHPNAMIESIAFECAASLGGNDAFWKYANRLYEITPSDQGQELDQKQLPIIASFAGLDVLKFNECLISGKFTDKINKQYTDGVNAMLGIPPEQRGTPFSVIISPSGKKIPLVGAQNYSTLKNIIETVLSEES